MRAVATAATSCTCNRTLPLHECANDSDCRLLMMILSRSLSEEVLAICIVGNLSGHVVEILLTTTSSSSSSSIAHCFKYHLLCHYHFAVSLLFNAFRISMVAMAMMFLLLIILLWRRCLLLVQLTETYLVRIHILPILDHPLIHLIHECFKLLGCIQIFLSTTCLCLVILIRMAASLIPAISMWWMRLFNLLIWWASSSSSGRFLVWVMIALRCTQWIVWTHHCWLLTHSRRSLEFLERLDVVL